jgi:pyroglutamyl-peptidase
MNAIAMTHFHVDMALCSLSDEGLVLKILITGFEPFGGETLNPSWEVAQMLHGKHIQGVLVVAEKLPCVFSKSLDALSKAIHLHQPVAVMALGQADGRSDFSIERVAINVCDARIPDNEGAQPVDEPVIANAPAAYFSTLPIKKMAAQLRAFAFPVAISQTAGTFVCNQVFYGLQHMLAHTQTPSGFVHVPLLPAQVAARSGASLASMSTETLSQALLCALSVLVHHVQDGGADAKIGMGANH